MWGIGRTACLLLFRIDDREKKGRRFVHAGEGPVGARLTENDRKYLG